MKKNKQRILSFVIAIMTLIGLFSGCGAETGSANATDAAAPSVSAAQPASASDPAPDTRTVTDQMGYDVAIPGEITNFFCPWVGGTAIFTLLGVNEAQSYYIDEIAKDGQWLMLKKLNPYILERPSAGEGSKITDEEMMSLDFDLLIGVTEENAQKFRELGVNAFTSISSTTSDYVTLIGLFGELFGGAAAARAQEYITYVGDIKTLVSEHLKDLPEDQRISVYSCMGQSIYFAGMRYAWATDFIKAGGCIVAGEDITMEGFEITAEELLNIDPDVIVMGSTRWMEAEDALKTDAAASNLRAVQDGKILHPPAGISSWELIGCEYALMPLWLAMNIYPDYFTDIDLKQVTKDFYLKFFDYALSDAEYDIIVSRTSDF
jgi:iron complex transport system substrate-binding protein